MLTADCITVALVAIIVQRNKTVPALQISGSHCALSIRNIKMIMANDAPRQRFLYAV